VDLHCVFGDVSEGMEHHFIVVDKRIKNTLRELYKYYLWYLQTIDQSLHSKGESIEVALKLDF
jgi:hypothetical protein